MGDVQVIRISVMRDGATGTTVSSPSGRPTSEPSTEGMTSTMTSRDALDVQSGGPRLSRRGFLLAGAVAGGALAVPGLLTPSPAWATTDPFTTYHGLDSAGHQQKITDLSAQGYRMISLSVYGSPAQYAAIWVQRSGPAWMAVQDLSPTQYQTTVTNYVAQGYYPTIVTATGPRNTAVFAAVFEQIAPDSWFARHDQDYDTFVADNRAAHQDGLIMSTLAIYGDATDRRFAAVWLPNPTGVKWYADAPGDSDDYQDWFDASLAAWVRPAIVDANDDGQYVALTRDDHVGQWYSYHGMTTTEYETKLSSEVAAGRVPVSLQGSGPSSDIRYSAVFITEDPPIARQWTRTDSVGASYTGIHDVVQTFMQTYGLRGGQFAIRKNGTMQLAAGYSWTEPGTAITQPDSPMRLASVSKAFTSAAITALRDNGLDLNTKVFPYLGITTVALPSQTKDSRVDDITLQELVDHYGGWVRDEQYGGMDPVFEGRKIARDLGLSGRVTKWDVARYMYGEPLQYTPGDTSTTFGLDKRYSNFGYLLLGLVVEQRTGQSFFNYVKSQILVPLGLDSDVFLGATLRSDALAGEVNYDSPAVGLSAWDPWSDDRVPSAYGNFLIAEMDSGGGLVSSAPALATFIGSHATWGLGGRSPGYARTGGMPGTASRIESRTDGIDWAYIFNAREFPTVVDANGDDCLVRFAKDLNDAITAAGI